MPIESDYQNDFNSRKSYLAAVLSQTVGINTIVILPHQAVKYGAAGHIILFGIISIFVGIPLLYMEYVIGQFTGRDVLLVWRVRPCLSHIAYVQIFWQIINVIVNHVLSAFTLHYLFISFEDPIPYYACGQWSTQDCDILFYNYTIHQDCLKTKDRMPYCTQLCTTFPEYQYWRYHILRINKEGYYLAWRVCLASGIICIVLFLSCFQRSQSVKASLQFYVLFIISFSILFLIASMLQKGVVVKFEAAMDVDLLQFVKYLEISSSIQGMLLNLSIGCGISFNVASRSSFRSPCYSNIIIVVVITWALTVINICSSAIMLCPYSFKHNIHPLYVTKYPMYITYETIPRMLYVYNAKSVWIVLSFCLIVISFLCINTIIISSLIEIMAKRNSIVASYPGVITMVTLVALYVLTIPLLGNKTFNFMLDFQRGINFLPILVALIESFVFLLCYGLGRFSEDIHFMLGVRPNAFIKMTWIFSFFVLIYTFCMELYTLHQYYNTTWGAMVSWWFLVFIMTLVVTIIIGKIALAFYKNNLDKEVGLDSSWGPKSELLQRSRAMFTTHAMTKEYIYRQYHLQAGILMRQRTCNIRV